MDFPFSFPCPDCHTRLKIKDESVLGRTIMCPQCGKKMTATAPENAADDHGDNPFNLNDEPELLKQKRVRPKSNHNGSRSIGKKSKTTASTKSRSSDSSALQIALGAAAIFLVSIGMILWMFGGRIATTLARTAARRPGEAAGTVADPYSAAINDANAAERPYLVAAKPFLEAIRSRDYAAVYRTLSSHARAAIQPEQFVTPTEENHVALPLMNEVTEEQFADSMKTMESARGIPVKLLNLYVHSADSNILAGRGDAIETMFAIGGMPKEIPANIRKASIRAQFQCDYSDEQVKQIAQAMNISEDQIRSGKIDGEEIEEDTDEQPYFNLKFVLVEEAGELKVGYFEFMPPSILD